ncbi:hypothetical protein GDO86_008028, partial [Hymenochirus boettgeri]
MSHSYVGPLSAYNSLNDKHLTGYFNNTRIRRHLQRAGLITRSGRILSEKEYKINTMRRDHQKYIRQCLAQAIFHKVLDMERHHQIEIKRKLETFARKERIQRIKADHSKTLDEEAVTLFSPRPPTGPKSLNRHNATYKERSDSSDSISSPRPSTAPGNMQRPVRLQPLPGYPGTSNAPKTSFGSRQKPFADEQEQQFPTGVDRDLLKLMNTVDYSVGISPYRLPIINNFVMPAPPTQRKPPKQLKQTLSTSSRGRRFRPTTAPNALELTAKDPGKFHKTSLHSNIGVTMVYLGKNVHLSHDDDDFRDEIKVFQQHCGGENLCVFKGRLLEGEHFNLISRRHRGFPFSLTFYINGMQVDRLSSCCEYKHRKGARLGGKNGYFGFLNVEGASPCYRCIIAMGLDKKPSPPPKKAKEDEEENKEDDKNESMGDKEGNSMERDEENEESDGIKENLVVETSSIYDKTDMEYEEEQDETFDEEKEEEENEEYEADDEAKDEYDEDFEVEEEKPDEKSNEEGQVDDQVNGNSKSPSDDEKDDLDHEGESNKASKEAMETSDSEEDERDGHSDSEYEEDKQGKHSIADKEMNTAARKLFYRNRKTHQQSVPKQKTDVRSVQEKIAEAIDKDDHFNSEPEPSDSSTDDEDNYKCTFAGSTTLEHTFHETEIPGQMSQHENEELEECDMATTKKADYFALESSSVSLNLIDSTINEQSPERHTSLNELETGSQYMVQHVLDEQEKNEVEATKPEDEHIYEENIDNDISEVTLTDFEKNESETSPEASPNEENLVDGEAVHEKLSEVNEDKEIQNDNDEFINTTLHTEGSQEDNYGINNSMNISTYDDEMLNAEVTIIKSESL